MPWRRQAILLLLAGAVLFLLSCAAKAPRSSPVPQSSVPPPAPSPGPNAVSAQYSNSAEGLRTLLNDLLTATRNGDTKTVDTLMKQAEFPDYGEWFLHTYSPDPETADGWAHSYRDNLGRNEGLFRELLATLAKDNSSKILVRKVNDNPESNNGLERGMLQYARAPVDIYSATLSSPSHDEPIERRGYFVYVDGMFRWENLADFAKPDTYLSDPARPPQESPAISGAGSSAETLASIKYANTPDGLRSFLNDLLAAAKTSHHEQVNAIIKQTEIPDYRSWYCSMYIPGSALSWANSYGKNLGKNKEAFAAFWESLAKDNGDILVHKLIDKPGGTRNVEWGMLHNSRTPLDMYHASWKSDLPSDSQTKEIGYFIFIDGMFRWDSLNHVMGLRFEKSPPAAAKSQKKEMPLSGPAFKVGDSVSAPKVISTTQPEYTKSAREAHLEGTVVLSVVVDIDGRAKDIKVAKALGSGLDERAIDSLRGWSFTPGSKDGQPVPVQINIEVTFRFY